MNSKQPPSRSTNSAPETMEDKQRRAQPLKVCDKCGNQAETTGGIEVRGKWFCGRCWIKWINGK